MVTPMSTATPTRGRPRTFDEEAVLDALTALFWRQGYEATSMADIVEASGLNKSSLYNTFGSKQELFATILDRYVDMRMQFLRETIEASGDGIDGLHRFLDTMRGELDTEHGRNGCLCVNTTAELGTSDTGVTDCGLDYRGRMRNAWIDVLETAAETSAFDRALAEPRADLMLMLMLGISVAVRGGASGDELDRLFTAAHATVESWRT